jgi:hypothetical protein
MCKKAHRHTDCDKKPSLFQAAHGIEGRLPRLNSISITGQSCRTGTLEKDQGQGLRPAAKGWHNSEEFVLEHMEVFWGPLMQKPKSLVFPVSMTAAAFGAALSFGGAADTVADHNVTGYSLLAAMMTLALMENWVLRLPPSVAEHAVFRGRTRRNRARARGPKLTIPD